MAATSTTKAHYTNMKNQIKFEAEDMSPLHIAVKKNCTHSLVKLLSDNVSLHSRDLGGFSAVHLAVRLRHRQIVNLLLKASIGDNPTDAWGFSHIHAAAMLDWYNVVAECIKMGANPNQRVVEERGVDSLRVVEIMDQCRASHRQRVWPVRLVCYWQDGNMTNPTTNEINTDEYWPGYSPLHFAIENRAFTTFTLLLRKGANPNLSTDTGLTPLHMACALPDDINREYVRWLLVANADINARTITGETPMHVAVHHGNVKALEVMVYCKITFANVHIVNNTGQTCLHVLANTSPTHPDERYRTDVPEQIKVKMAEILLEKGCRVDVRQHDNKTALDVAQENNLMEVADTLRRSAGLFALKEETQETMSYEDIMAELDKPLEGD